MAIEPRGEFGRRKVGRPLEAGPARRSSGPSPVSKWFASAPPHTAGPDAVVPTSLLAILQAAVGMLIVQMLLVFLLNGGLAAPGHGPPPAPAFGSPTFMQFVVPILLMMAWNAAHFAAIYSMAAHATLRWIGVSNPQAYALGGLAAGFALQALNALQGAHPTVYDLVIGLAGGLTAGYLYRLTAGMVERAQA